MAVAIHYLAVTFLLPAAVYPGGRDFGGVVLYAVILLIEEGALGWLALTVSNLFEMAAERSAEVEAASAAEARANTDRSEAERKAKQDRDAARRELAAGFERKVGTIVEAGAAGTGEKQGPAAS